MKGVLLINMPFAALDSPSLALGLFRSRLRADGVPCDVRQLNLTLGEMIGWEQYDFVLRLPAIFAGEQLFARALFGDRLPTDSEYYGEVLSEGLASQDVPLRLQQIRAAVEPFLRHALESIPWDRYDIIGFTSLFEQNLPSLALAARVKGRYPHKLIVFGGANCEDIMGITMHRVFPFIDFVCSGEGDDSFPELVKRLAYGHPVTGLRGLVYREGGRTIYSGPAAMVNDLDRLPLPDYDDYFTQLYQSPLSTAIRPSILMESARGCWWGEKSHCTFCGLNGLTMEFRTKNAARAIDELERLQARYGVSIVRFTDNIMAVNYFKEFVPAVAARGPKADLIFEVKANLKKEQIKGLAAAGITVQAGIESLSTHVLKLMGKGSNSLMNIQTLKWCKQYGVQCDWNLLYGFPGEVPDDYRRSAELAELLTHLHPPSGCGPIRLDRFSPNYKFATEKGFNNVRPMRLYRYLYPFPDGIMRDLVYYFDFDYATPIDDGGHLPALEHAVMRWKSRSGQLLASRSGDAMVIDDTRPVALAPRTTLSGVAARLYEYCDRARSLAQVQEEVAASADSTADEVAGIVRELARRKLMVEEDGRFLSLAVMTYKTEYDNIDMLRTGGVPQAAILPPATVESPLVVRQNLIAKPVG